MGEGGEGEEGGGEVHFGGDWGVSWLRGCLLGDWDGLRMSDVGESRGYVLIDEVWGVYICLPGRLGYNSTQSS